MHKTLYIIRHGQTDYNKNKIVQGGGTDSVLNAKGQAQAQAFYEFYKEVEFDLVMTSSLQRTHQTVAPFLQKQIEWLQFPELNEIHWGKLEGRKGDDWLHSVYANLTKEWSSGNLLASVDGGESAADLVTRLERFVDKLKLRAEQQILICTHGRTMRCLMSILSGQDATAMEQFQHANTGLYKVTYDTQQFTFELRNDTEHLVVV